MPPCPAHPIVIARGALARVIAAYRPCPAILAVSKLKVPCKNSTVRKNAGLATTREPLYFGPRLPKMAKVAKIGYEAGSRLGTAVSSRPYWYLT